MTLHSASPLPVTDATPAFDCDVLALHSALCAFSRQIAKQESDAEDLVQEMILKALADRHRFEPGTNLKAWLFTIMRNTFNSRWRRSCREVAAEPKVIELSAVTPATQETCLWAREVAERLLRDLKPVHREILILVPVRGLGYEEAAEACGCSVGTVKSRLNRAWAALAALVLEAA